MSFKQKFITKPNKYVIAAIAVFSLFIILRPFFSSTEKEQLTAGNIFKAEVLEVVHEEEEQNEYNDRTTVVQTLRVLAHLPDGEKELEVLNDYTTVRKGAEIFIHGSPSEESDFYVVDVSRKNGLIWLVAAFILVALAVSGVQGLNSLVGLAFSFVVIFFFIIPKILAGFDPLLIGIAGSILIVCVALYAAHGFNRKSLAALIGISLTLVVVSIVAKIGVHSLYLTGFGGEESLYLTQATDNSISLVNILIAGIVIAAIGILDDVAITQASTVFNLSGTHSKTELFKKAMIIGRDHISAVINTLVLAYVGAALPLILLLASQRFAVGFVINGQVIAEEIARTIISTIGLLLAVPLTTIIAVWMVKEK
ncbi:MAG: YibE/F family protein [bacterium]|nr:YibE/F family protein [bacterium]